MGDTVYTVDSSSHDLEWLIYMHVFEWKLIIDVIHFCNIFIRLLAK